MESDLQNSKCKDGWLHRYRQIKEFPSGVLEICEICHDRQFFHHKTPNHVYLSYHLRQTLQLNNPRFNKEYK